MRGGNPSYWTDTINDHCCQYDWIVFVEVDSTIVLGDRVWLESSSHTPHKILRPGCKTKTKGENITHNSKYKGGKWRVLKPMKILPAFVGNHPFYDLISLFVSIFKHDFTHKKS